MMDFLGTANLMWSTHWPEEERLSKIVQSLLPEVRRRLSGRALPSEDGDPVEPLDISRAANLAGVKSVEGFELPARGVVVVGVEGERPSPLPRASEAIPVGADVSSIVFLHASVKGASNDMSYRYIHNFPDTADLLGWYEVVYQDGFVETVPVRFGWNILPLSWGRQSDVVAKGNAKELSYAYAADAVFRDGVTWFSYEWVNPRFGRPVKEIKLHGTTRFMDTRNKPTPTNAIVLAGVSVVKKRPVPPSDAR